MRYECIDILRGVAVIFMIIFHIFYFPNKYGYKEFNYDTTGLNLTARIAQIIFITLVGINIYLSYKNSKTKEIYYTKQLNRILKLILIAIFITIFSYFIFGDSFVKFGILHFLAIASLLLMLFVDNQKVIIGIIFLILIVKLLIYYDRNMFLFIPKKLAFITGFYSSYSAVDHFPIIPWITYVCIGLLIGKYVTDKDYKINTPELYRKLKDSGSLKGIQWCGKRSLEIYVIHWILLYLFFAHMYPKLKK